MSGHPATPAGLLTGIASDAWGEPTFKIFAQVRRTA
jgi:hypothetical protein